MNSRTKLLIFALLAAVLFLSTAIISFRLASPAGEQLEQETQPAENRNAVSLIEGSDGLWGAVNANGRVLIEPIWGYLRIMSDSVLIARPSESKSDQIGLLRTNGEQLVPFIYQSIVPVAASNSDLWLAAFTENNKIYYHLYHADGTRWSDKAWDSYSYEEGMLTLESGKCRRKGKLHDQQIEWTEWHTAYPVGLHMLTMDLDEIELKNMPSAEILSDIGETAAAYLRYLFVTKQQPDDTLLSPENSHEICVGSRYESCRLVSADISRIKTLETEGLPSYLVQIQVKYQIMDSKNDLLEKPFYEDRKLQEKYQNQGGILETVQTSMLLTLTRNASGALTYSGFRDSQMYATGIA